MGGSVAHDGHRAPSRAFVRRMARGGAQSTHFERDKRWHRSPLRHGMPLSKDSVASVRACGAEGALVAVLKDTSQAF